MDDEDFVTECLRTTFWADQVNIIKERVALVDTVICSIIMAPSELQQQRLNQTGRKIVHLYNLLIWTQTYQNRNHF